MGRPPPPRTHRIFPPPVVRVNHMAGRVWELGGMGQKKLGAVGAILSLMLTTGAASQPAAAASRAGSGRTPSPLSASLCRLGFASIPMTPLASGHHMVEVSVNGRAGAFLVDTGAGVTIVHTPSLESFGLAPAAGGHAAGTLTGVVPFAPVAVARFAIGGTATQMSRIYAMDLSHIVETIAATTRQPIQGLIGQDVMRAQEAIIDVEHSVLYLKTVDASRADPALCNDETAPAGTAIAKVVGNGALQPPAVGLVVSRE
ncbi:hypothetical protein DF286_13090 [Sphingosinicella humi]|uniref:Peptidase A2 domain-containing protein n=2 Tax=Allosphingosinicella humi TaxID=2068657 RepID=A0A2U2J5U9_9SPHN|nr:hypothetical protein DF286_13090 [Sphingosinicella humi]